MEAEKCLTRGSKISFLLVCVVATLSLHYSTLFCPLLLLLMNISSTPLLARAHLVRPLQKSLHQHLLL
jgi:hypothetical protein